MLRGFIGAAAMLMIAAFTCAGQTPNEPELVSPFGVKFYSQPDEKNQIVEAEKKFSNSAEKDGFERAFADVAAGDVRLSRSGKVPAVGLEAARGVLLGDGNVRWSPAGHGASRSGDLGYAYGVRERIRASATPDTSVFLDVWRREKGKWKLVLAVDNPVAR